MTKTTAINQVDDFEFFQGGASESRTRPRITIRRGGLMVITAAAAEMLGDDVTHVQLAYNSTTGAIGLRACEPDVGGCYRLRQQDNSPSRLIGGKRFFRHHQLEIDKARTFDAEDFGRGIVGFRFEQPASVPEQKSKTTSRRKSKPAA